MAIVLDYISGTWAAMSCGEWSSQVARKGLWHKLGEIFALLVAVMVDIAIGVMLKFEPVAGIVQFDYPHIFTLLVTMWYIFTELGSIIENASKLGAPMPKWLTKMIKKLQDGTEAAGDGLVEKITEPVQEKQNE